MNNPDIAFIDTVKTTVKYLISRSVGGAMMGLGHLIFAIHFVWFLSRKCEQQGPTILDSE